MTAVVALCSFAAVITLGFAFYGYFNRSLLDELLSEHRGLINPRPLLEWLWGYARAGMEFEQVMGIATASLAVAVALGMLIEGISAALILGVGVFIVSPRLYAALMRRRFCREFELHYPLAVASLAATAEIMNIRSAFRHAASLARPPTDIVFRYIAASLESGTDSPYRAVMDAAREFDLPILEHLGSAVRALDELGGGEEAVQLLEATAEEARFKRNHRMEVKRIFAELQGIMLAATLVPIFMFLVFAADASGEYRAVLMDMPWLFVIGVMVIIFGWVAAKSMIDSAFYGDNN